MTTDGDRGQGQGQGQGQPNASPKKVAMLAVRAIVAAVLPLVLFLVVRPYVASNVEALVIGAAVPVLYTVGGLIVRRRLDRVGLASIGGFLVGILILVATGGSELAFLLRKEIVTGPLGLVCIASAFVHRPLLVVVARFAARRNQALGDRLNVPGADHILSVSTVVVGAILAVHALAMLALALNTDTTTFLAVSRPVSWVISLGGLAPLLWWIRRQTTHRERVER